jgi:exopolysaccharide biosynthesis polyprenyl glycosylphosphotransferase
MTMGILRQSTPSALPLTGQTTLRDHAVAGSLRHRRPTRPRGPLQRVLEGRGWSILRAVADFTLMCCALALALGAPSALQISGDAAPLLMIPPLAMLALYLKGLYQVRMRALVLDGLIPAISAVSAASMAAATIGLLINGSMSSPSQLVRIWLFAVIGVCAGRTVLAFAQRRARIAGMIGKPVLIVGAGIVGSQVARRLDSHPEYGLVPVGFLDDDPRSVAEVGGRDVPVLGAVDDLDRIVRQAHVRNVVVAFSTVADERLARLIQRCQVLGIEVSVVPRMFDTINNRIAYDPVGGLPLMSFSAVDPKGVQFTVKHAFDRIFAALLVVLLSPLLIAVAIAVRISSHGSVLYRQRRVGRDGTEFNLYKFRSMVSQSNEDEDEHDAVDDLLAGDVAPGGVEGPDRRTAIGRLMRRTSIDELPQLFNVLRGEMSIVGPRPERPQFVNLFTQDVVRYSDRHRVKSGITGWAQVHGLRGQTSLAERIELDNYYIAHWSLGLDMKVLILTVKALLHSAE